MSTRLSRRWPWRIPTGRVAEGRPVTRCSGRSAAIRPVSAAAAAPLRVRPATPGSAIARCRGTRIVSGQNPPAIGFPARFLDPDARQFFRLQPRFLSTQGRRARAFLSHSALPRSL
jgi:hypothetical protein